MREKLVWILWPSFITAIAMECVIFSLFDPLELEVFGFELAEHRLAAYTLGFFLFWIFAASSSALTVFFQKPNSEVNKFCVLPCPLVKSLDDEVEPKQES